MERRALESFDESEVSMTCPNLLRQTCAIRSAASVLLISVQCHAAVIYSGVVNIPIPVSGSGVYLDVQTGVHGDSAENAPNWDVRFLPFSSNEMVLTAAPGTGFMRNQGVGEIAGRTRLDRNILVGPNSVYYGNSTAKIGELPGQWGLNSVGTLGLKFGSSTGQTYYGWIRLRFGASAADCSIVDFAFENGAFSSEPGIVVPCTPSFAGNGYQVDGLSCEWTYTSGFICGNPPSSPTDFRETRYFDGSALYGTGWVIRGPLGQVSSCMTTLVSRNGVATFDVGLTLSHNSRIRIARLYNIGGGFAPISVRDSANQVIAQISPGYGSPGELNLEAGAYRLAARSPGPVYVGAGGWFGDGIVVTASLLTLRVPAQYPTIQAAIDAAPATAGWCVEVDPGIYNEAIDFKGKPISVKATGARAETIIDGTGLNTSVVRAVAGETPATVLDGLTIRNGATGSAEAGFRMGGGMLIRDSSPTIRNCAFVSNHAGYGGAIYALNSSALIERSSIVGNTAEFDGGGLQANQSAVHVADVQFEGNSCGSRGGGLHLVQGQPQLARVSVMHNRSGSSVGGVSWFAVGSNSSAASVIDCVISQNVAVSFAGGIGISSESGTAPTMTVAGTTVCRNFPMPNIAGEWLDNGSNSVCLCECDITGSGTVDGADLGILLTQWGPRNQQTLADFDGDGEVNGADLAALLSMWGPCPQ